MNPVFYVLSKAFWRAFGGSVIGITALLYAPHLIGKFPLYEDAIYAVAFLVAFIFAGIPILQFLFVVYFLPSITANGYNHRNRRAIFALNLLLGWTFIGWALALVWALTDDPASSSPALAPSAPTPEPEPAPVDAQGTVPSDDEELLGQKVVRAFKEGVLGGRR